MHVMSIVGARPQFIKLAPFSAEVRRQGHRETIVHTGQHYDDGMSARFFDELQICEPDVNLGVGSGSHGAMTARALEGIEREIVQRKPDVVIVFGDTNSTLAGALAAVKLHVPCAHVEAGLRSFAREMPEEINRVVADHCADLLLAPNDVAMANLAREGIGDRAVLVGDIMVDALYSVRERMPDPATILTRIGITPAPYLLLTVHRASNTDDPARLAAIFEGLRGGPPAIFPVHPRTRKAIDAQGLKVPDNVRPVDPLGYIEVVALQSNALAVVTDSGGLQKEAYLLETPCITLRQQTEWVETVELGWNVLVGADSAAIAAAIASPPRGRTHPTVYGDGTAAKSMVQTIAARFGA